MNAADKLWRVSFRCRQNSKPLIAWTIASHGAGARFCYLYAAARLQFYSLRREYVRGEWRTVDRRLLGAKAIDHARTGTNIPHAAIRQRLLAIGPQTPLVLAGGSGNMFMWTCGGKEARS